MKQRNSQTRSAVCVKNDGYPASLEVRKIYRMIPDAHAAEHRFARVIDESAEDYLYPADYFVPIELPQALAEVLADEIEAFLRNASTKHEPQKQRFSLQGIFKGGDPVSERDLEDVKQRHCYTGSKAMMSKNTIENRLHEEALALGADYFGVADLSPAQELVRELGGQMAAQFPRAISIGVKMPLAIVDQLSRHDDKAVALAYRSHGYEILNFRLDQIASRLSSALQQEGYRSFPVQAAQSVDGERHYGLFSHKLAAHLAGLGWIGKSCLLVTPEVGPRVRWASILTDAPLTTGQPLEVRCGGCKECVEACPTQAFTGRNFQADEPRDARFDVSKCYEYQRQKREYMDSILCGICVYVCPHGRRKLQTRSTLSC